MSDAISSVPTQIQQAVQQTDGGQRADQVGQFRGESVQVITGPDLQTLARDAAEELTFGHSEKTSKKLADRKAKDRKSRAQELAAKFQKKVPDAGPAQKFHEFAEHLKKQGISNAGVLRQQLKENFGEISHQYTVLQYLDELLAGEGNNPELLAAVREARSELDQEHGERIRTDLNVGPVALRFDKLGEIPSLRQFYWDALEGLNGPQATIETLAQFGEENAELTSDFLIEALGTDLGSFGPNVDPRQLKATVDQIYLVGVVKNLNQRLQALVDEVNPEPESVEEGAGTKIATELLPLTEQRWIDTSKIQSLVNGFGKFEPPTRIHVLQQLAGIVRDLPEKIYQSGEDRDRLRGAIQDAVDYEIDLEDQ